MTCQVSGTSWSYAVEKLPFPTLGQPNVYTSTCAQAPAGLLAEQQIADNQHKYPHLKRFISQVLAQDPRPAYRKGEDVGREYAVLLLEFNVRWRVSGQQTEVLSLDLR